MSARERFVDIAVGEVGKPYELHRDCSGFTAWAARQVGITIPEGSVAQFSVGDPVPSKMQVQAGDLLFWDTFGAAPGHVAIAINPSQVVHAINEQQGIVIDPINADMGGPYMGARRIITEGAPVEPTEPTGKPSEVAGPQDGKPGPNPGPSTVTRKDRKKREKDRQRRGGRRGRR